MTRAGDERAGDAALMRLVRAIVADQPDVAIAMLRASPALATRALKTGATRSAARPFFFHDLARYAYAGDTALHFAAAAYRPHVAEQLLAAGADVRAANRRGDEPLHAAAAGVPGTAAFNPEAQAETIKLLIAAGADPNAFDKAGTTPLHRAVRTRCARAVEALLQGGADLTFETRRGSTALRLASVSSGRGGVGLPEAKAEQAKILDLLQRFAGAR